MPTRTIRLTLNLDEHLSARLDALATSLHLKRAVCARMLIVEAFAVRDLYPKVPPPPAGKPPYERARRR